MKFSELADYLQKLEETASRNEITEILADLFKKADKDEIDKVVYLILGRLAPSYENIVFNLAERMMLQILAKAYNKELDAVKKLYKQKGDLGEVAQELASDKGDGLTVVQVFEKLVNVANEEGEGSQDRKVQLMAELFKDIDPLSVRYVARIPVNKLRLGFSDKTVIDALSWMVNGDKSAKKKIEQAYQVHPDVGKLAREIKSKGIDKATKSIKPQVGVPSLLMLAQRLKSPKDMIKKMGKVAVEPKLDGLRLELHFKRSGFKSKNDTVKAYTRNLNETSWMFPELKNADKFLKGDELILDCEAVGIDDTRSGLANFQTTMTRRRKHEVKETAEKVPIKFYIFDILLKDKENLMDKTYMKRRKVLKKTVKEGKLFEVVESEITDNAEFITEQNELMRAEGLEGIIVKKVKGKYVPGRTGWRWVKMKEAEDSPGKLADTVDCLVMGYYVGRGKRTEFGIGGFLAGVADNDGFKTLTKVGTGLTDEQFRELHKRLSDISIDEKPKQYEVDNDLYPDVWATPELVVELAADDITKSPKHTAGYALRFPRLVKFRDDKDPEQATTLKEVKKLYKMQ